MGDVKCLVRLVKETLRHSRKYEGNIKINFRQDIRVWNGLIWHIVEFRYYFLFEGFCLKVAIFFLWGALSDERTGLQFAVQSLNDPSHAEHVTILYCLI
jgi:hypothetical protein